MESYSLHLINLEGFPRAVGSHPQHPAISADSDSLLRSLSGESAAAVAAAADAGGIRVAAAGDIVGDDAVWLGDVFYRLFVDAVGDWIGFGVLFRRDCFEFVDDRSCYSLLHFVASVASKRCSRLETPVKKQIVGLRLWDDDRAAQIIFCCVLLVQFAEYCKV
ncbi:hypothetical protein ACET3Z_025816 [Daucus carota]